jgi:K+-transporting ATPase c subunit
MTSFSKLFSDKSPLAFKPRNKKKKNKKQYNKSTKGSFNVSIKNKDKKQKKQTNKSVWKANKKCFNLRADGTCMNPNEEIV